MDVLRRPAPPDRTVPCWEAGLGVRCPEAQADGVPCFEIGGDCSDCEHAVAFVASGDEGPPGRSFRSR